VRGTPHGRTRYRGQVIWLSVVVLVVIWAGTPLLLDRIDRRRPEEDLSKQVAPPSLGDQAERWLRKR